MLFSPITWALFAFTLMVALPGALAAPVPKKSSRKNHASTRVTVETYPAMEDGEILAPPAPRMEPKRKVVLDTVVVSQSQASAQVAPKTAPATDLGSEAPRFVSSAPAAPLSRYVQVPAEKRAQIMKRMNLCQRLFEVSGRAYDYRAMTTEELEQEYVALSNVKRSVTLRQDSSGLFRPVERMDESGTTVPSRESAAAPAAEAEKDPILDAE